MLLLRLYYDNLQAKYQVTIQKITNVKPYFTFWLDDEVETHDIWYLSFDKSLWCKVQM